MLLLRGARARIYDLHASFPKIPQVTDPDAIGMKNPFSGPVRSQSTKQRCLLVPIHGSNSRKRSAKTS